MPKKAMAVGKNKKGAPVAAGAKQPFPGANVQFGAVKGKPKK